MKKVTNFVFALIASLAVSTTLFAQENENKSELKLIKESGEGKLYEANGFLIPVISGSTFEMGKQYGELMVEEMEKVYTLLIKGAVEKGELDDETISFWVNRAYGTGSVRTKQFYEGVAEGTGWSLNKVVFLDQVMEYAGLVHKK